MILANFKNTNKSSKQNKSWLHFFKTSTISVTTIQIQCTLVSLHERQHLMDYHAVNSGWYGGHNYSQSHIQMTAGGRGLITYGDVPLADRCSGGGGVGGWSCTTRINQLFHCLSPALRLSYVSSVFLCIFFLSLSLISTHCT